MLGEKGYTTVLVGRNMHQMPVCKMCGYQKQILGSTYVSDTYVSDDDYDSFLKKAAPDSGGIANVIKSLGLNCNRSLLRFCANYITIYSLSTSYTERPRFATDSPPIRPCPFL